MSRLYSNEEGRVIPTLCEEVTSFRRARTNLTLPENAGPGTLFILAKPHPDIAVPLRIDINGVSDLVVKPGDSSFYKWYEIDLSAQQIPGGRNVLEFCTDSDAMDCWSLALEPGRPNTQSSLSDDGGNTWRSDRMGYLNAVCAEYVVRFRSSQGSDGPPPPLTLEPVDNPRSVALRERVPPLIRRLRSRLEQVRALSTWICMGWEHTGSGRASQYTPWDAATILSWGDKRLGHGNQRPIVMCVHYGVTLVTVCQSLGIPARCVVLMGNPNGTDGHFVAEVWLEEYGKWVVVDSNADAMFFDGQMPMSALEVKEKGDDLSEYVRWGAGSAFQRTFSHIRAFVDDNLMRNVCFRHVSIWPHSDLLSHPEKSPPGHGSTSYCETDLVWAGESSDTGFGMFRYFADTSYYNTPPEGHA